MWHLSVTLLLQILNWLATFKPRQFTHATSVPDIVTQLCLLGTEEHPSDTHASDEDAIEDCPPPRLFAPQVSSPRIKKATSRNSIKNDVQSGLANPKLDNLISYLTEVDRRVQFNRVYVVSTC
jgi:hypothetical protein